MGGGGGRVVPKIKNQISCLDGLIEHRTVSLYTVHSITCIMLTPSQQSVKIKCFCCEKAEFVYVRECQ